MTTSCYLPVFYCLESFDSFVFISQSSYAATKLENTSLSGQVTTFTLDSFIRTHQVFTVNFSGLFYCLIVNVHRLRLFAVNVLYFITLIRLCQQVFWFIFLNLSCFDSVSWVLLYTIIFQWLCQQVFLVFLQKTIIQIILPFFPIIVSNLS